MKITKVSVKRHHSGIPLAGKESLHNALAAFAGGTSKGSGATRDRQTRDVTRAHGEHAAVFEAWASTLLAPNTKQLVDRLVDDAIATLKGRDSFHRSFDYDAMGTSFFKTNVDVLMLDRKEQIYLLRLSAAYVGDEVEIGLAEALGIPRGLQWVRVTAEVKPVDNRFEFDFEQLVRSLDPVLGTRRVKGTQIAKAMMAGDRYGGSPSFPLMEKKGIRVIIFPENVTDRFDWRQDGKDTWSIRGAVLSGLLKPSYEDETIMMAPAIGISITTTKGSKYTRLPAVDPAMKQAMKSLAKAIAGALRS